jgi:pilus assembly protein FimV
MKRPLQLPLAIALALGGTNAMALGLGPVHVKSKLNQPLDAEIPVIQGTAGEAEGLLISMAAAEDFERVGISRSHLNVPLEFSVVKGANGQTVIRVTSKEPVRDSYLDFLVEANWPKGRLLREYTVLLDPPVTAPATRTATTAAVATTPAPAAATPPPRREKEKVASAEKPPAPPREVTKPATPAAAPAPARARKVIEGEYGPIKEGETLSGIARAARPDASVNVDQVMLALLKSNPNAFYKDNINALKRGAILRLPTADEAKAIGSATEAAAQVRSQIEDWSGARAAPTRVAATADKPAAPAAAPKEPKAPKASTTTTTASTAKTPSERLELVPPKAGADSMAMADRPGSGAGSAGSSAETKRELARTKEALTARDQEAGELKSRVKELEELKGKNDRLINLKDSEIADLQQKLKDLQAKAEAAAKTAAAKPATTTPATSTASTTTPTTPSATVAPAAATATPPAANAAIDKKDIWGDAGKAASTTPPANGAKAPDTHASTTTPPATGSTSTTTPAATTPTAPVAATATPPGSTATSSTTPPGTTPSGTTPPAPGVTVTPLAATPPTTSSTGTASTTTPPKPTAAATTAPKKPATPAVKPVAPEAAWYDAGWVKPTALGAGVLLVLLGLLGMRKRKAAPLASTGAGPRGSIADAFGDSSIPGGQGGSDVMEAEAAHLRDQLARDPTNPGLYLELLSLYYAERDVARFEDTAAEMHAHITDPHQPEWLETQAMGQELAPHNPLFSEGAHYDAHDTGYADTLERPTLDDDDLAFAHQHSTYHTPTPAPAASARDSDFGFGITHPEPTVRAPQVPPPPADDAFTFDDLPPLESPKSTRYEPMEAAPAMKDAPTLDDDFFSGDDAIGTKLDLAKAYMDMGDPDGARSMLEEVVAEGNDAQKAEAHRLISELR